MHSECHLHVDIMCFLIDPKGRLFFMVVLSAVISPTKDKPPCHSLCWGAAAFHTHDPHYLLPVTLVESG